LLKTGIKLIFPIYEELLHVSHVSKIAKGLKGSLFCPENLGFSLFFTFFLAHGFAWCHLQCDRYDLNVKFLIFSRNFTRSIVLKFRVKTLVNQKNFSSLITTNMELRFEPCMLNLIWKWGAKDPKKREDHLIFHNFWNKEVHCKEHPKKN
jgi:hypothetical protein